MNKRKQEKGNLELQLVELGHTFVSALDSRGHFFSLAGKTHLWSEQEQLLGQAPPDECRME